jgi:hypothetical protein
MDFRPIGCQSPNVGFVAHAHLDFYTKNTIHFLPYQDPIDKKVSAKKSSPLLSEPKITAGKKHIPNNGIELFENLLYQIMLAPIYNQFPIIKINNGHLKIIVNSYVNGNIFKTFLSKQTFQTRTMFIIKCENSP